MAKKKIKNKGKQVVKPPVVEKLSSDAIAAVYSAVSQPVVLPVFVKVCRLCESKDGPFLNIFDADKVTAKKIDDLMPFSVTENDDLPHKICFRCSAKLEELYEFIQKCIKTQENLRSALGKNGPFLTKSKMRKKLWEEKLNKTNMSNDDICDALIKKAMEGIKAIPAALPAKEEPATEPKRVTRSKEAQGSKKEIKVEKTDDNDDISLKQVKSALDKSETKPPSNKTSRSNRIEAKSTESAQQSKTEIVEAIKTEVKQGRKSQTNLESSQSSSNKQSEKKQKTKTSINNLSFDYEPEPDSVKESNTDSESSSKEQKKEEPKKPFNIMDHISMIKVNGVGILFQCKLCNRNFLKKEVVESHSCAKNGVPKVDIPKSIPIPEPPKVPSVKYIKIDSDMKKSLTEKVRLAEKSESEKRPVIERPVIENDLTQDDEPPPKMKTKPRAGPASKTKRSLDTAASSNPGEPPNTNQPIIPTAPSLQFQTMPNLNSRFKIVPGPNNMFTLVEDTSSGNSQPPTNSILPLVDNTPASHGEAPPPIQETKKGSRKRKADEVANHSRLNLSNREIDKSINSEIIDLEDQSKPYPVGLFQTHAQPTPATFTTPAMKKQSYTIVQTGNPSKLLISTKARAAETDATKKRPRKTKAEVREESESKEPYTVTLEDVAPPKDNFFTFINVDPLLQPSYVLPTDNIIQESQISTSSSVLRTPVESKDKGKYTCNMCEESFSREKKLLAHIQSHYTKMDEEDELRAEKTTKKKGKK